MLKEELTESLVGHVQTRASAVKLQMSVYQCLASRVVSVGTKTRHRLHDGMDFLADKATRSTVSFLI